MEFQFRTVSERDDSDSRLDVGALWAMGRKRLAKMGALEAFDAAVRLLVVFVASGAVVIAYAIWAMGYSGVALPSVPLSLHRDGNTVTGTATMTLGSAMKPLRLGLAEQLHSRPDSRFSIQVRDGQGGLIYDSSSTHLGIKSAPDHVTDWSSTMGTIDVPQDGTYLFTCRWDSTEPGRVIEGARLQLRRNTRETGFMRNAFLVFGAGLVGSWWWLHRYRSVFRRQSAVAEPAAPPLLEHESAGALAAAAPGRSPPGPSSPMQMVRLVTLEVLGFLLSSVRLPIVGAYGVLVIIAGASLFSGIAPNSFTALMELPLTARILMWIYPQGHYEGTDVLLATGRAIGFVTLAFYLLTLLLRAFLPKRPPSTFGRKIKRLCQWNLLFFGIMAVGLPFAKLPPGQGYWDVLGVFTFFLVTVFVPALALLAVSCGIEYAISRVDSGPPSLPRESLAPGPSRMS